MKKEQTTAEKGQVYADKNLKSRGQRLLNRNMPHQVHSDNSVLAEKKSTTKEGYPRLKGADAQYKGQDEFISRDNVGSRSVGVSGGKKRSSSKSK